MSKDKSANCILVSLSIPVNDYAHRCTLLHAYGRFPRRLGGASGGLKFEDDLLSSRAVRERGGGLSDRGDQFVLLYPGGG
jgi:hypothetical protein